MQAPTIQGSKTAITIVVMAAALMAMIDISIVNVALSDIRASFGTPIDQIGWVSTGYMMANIVVIPMTGWLQRRFGFRRYFSVSVLIFTFASALCGLAWNLPSLVMFRILQGMGGGAIIPTSQAILFARYPRAQHGMAAALFGLGAITGPLLGPTIGGYMINWASWHWIFLVNVPIGLAVAFVIPRVLEEPGFKPDTARIDAVGIGLLAVGMASLQYVLEEGNREGWTDSTLILALAAVAAIALTTFIVHELETPNPVVDLRVFKNRSYAAGTGLNFLLGLAVFGASYLFSLYCGAVMSYQALDIGRIFLLAGASQIFLMPLIGKMSNKVDPRLMLVFGVSVTTVSQWVAAHLTSDAGFANLVYPNLIRSLGLVFVFVPASIAALSDLSPAQRGNATGLFNLTRELGGSLGTAWMGKLVADGIATHSSVLSEHISPYDPVAQEQWFALIKRGMDPAAALFGRMTREAMVMSFEDGFRMTMTAIALGLFMVMLLKRPRPVPSAEPSAAH
ncbi:MAG TPA: DHA2 family efflux MFS transporter permease subunit [Kofleriaceae bacterium]|jgi:DHA2 family multidrug resistance protein|nr:DHA2 family efflux MFS transporter permease subunit [Kofleriaceae bacterium]